MPGWDVLGMRLGMHLGMRLGMLLGSTIVSECQISQLCRTLNERGFPARLEGDDRAISGVNTLELACGNEVSFLSNRKYLDAVSTSKAGAIILPDNVPVPDRVSAIRCDDPYAAVTIAIITLHGYRKHPRWGLSENAVISPSARIGENPNIAAGVSIAGDVTIGDNCTIYPGSYVGDRAQIGDDCILFPNVVIYDDCVLGNRVTIHAGSVIGVDGLGYAPKDGKWIKIPQVGRAIIGDDVEIGANCSVDRATLGQTEIGSGTKFSDSIVIGHGAKLGSDCMLVGQVGVAGSATVGRHVTLAGQVGVAGHITVGDGVSAGGGAAILSDVEPNSTVLGSPAVDARSAKRSVIAVQQLPQWIRRIKDLEREVKALRAQMDENPRA